MRGSWTTRGERWPMCVSIAETDDLLRRRRRSSVRLARAGVAGQGSQADDETRAREESDEGSREERAPASTEE